eukprot:TRINITY_DN12839_c0_g1_i1.p1 TRINITY_DN12839_c0_g1~~TRINITY_DN12839_c0_g1_i1.p1  ORF type:complete len:239 (-),score=30.93 TRINITY_DN12839_c0_g1_i1:63-779(-)
MSTKRGKKGKPRDSAHTKRFSFGGGNRCNRCSKLVGFAEEKSYEQKNERLIFHSTCFNIWFKTKQKNQKLWSAQYSPSASPLSTPQATPGHSRSSSEFVPIPQSPSIAKSGKESSPTSIKDQLCSQLAVNILEDSRIVSNDSTNVYVWNGDDGVVERIFSLHASPISACVSLPESGVVVSLCSTEALVWEVSTGQVLESITEDIPTSIASTSSKDSLLLGFEGREETWKFKEGKLVKT